MSSIGQCGSLSVSCRWAAVHAIVMALLSKAISEAATSADANDERPNKRTALEVRQGLQVLFVDDEADSREVFRLGPWSYA